MAEKMPDEKENQAEDPQALVAELQGLLETMQNEPTPEGRMAKLKRIFEILEKFKAIMPPEQYAKQFGQLEAQLQQQVGQLEG